LAHHQHQFETAEQQKETSTLGMWAFLVQEVMFFGGLFGAYTIYRALYPEAFAEASLAGQPLRAAETQSSSPIAWLFDMLAHELCERAGVRPITATPTRSFLR